MYSTCTCTCIREGNQLWSPVHLNVFEYRTCTWVPKYTCTWVPKYTCTWVPKYTCTWVPKYTCTWVPKYTCTWVPKYTCTSANEQVQYLQCKCIVHVLSMHIQSYKMYNSTSVFKTTCTSTCINLLI